MASPQNFKEIKSSETGSVGSEGDDRRMQQLSRKASREDAIRDTWAVMEGEY